MIVVSDTSCLCYLARMSREAWLHDLYDEVFIHPAVAAELADGAATLPEIQALLGADWLIVRSIIETSSLELPADLDLGEAQAMQLYQEIHADLLMVDDLQGRRAAQKLGVRQIGLLGFLVAAKKAGLMTSPIKDEFESLLKLGFRASRQLVHDLIREAGE